LFSCPEHLAMAVQILDTREVPALNADGAEAKPPESYQYQSPIIKLFGEEMKPTLTQRFYASRWPCLIWFGGLAFLAAVLSVWGAGFELGFLRNWKMIGWYSLLSIITGALGYFLAIFPGMFFIGPLLHGRGLINGAPFEKGDRVQIIGGRFDQTQSEVCSGWQGDSVRVSLGDEAAERFQDVFSPTQLLRISNTEQGAAPNP